MSSLKPSNSTKYIILDFEFGMIQRTTIVLVSAALTEFKTGLIIKLSGTPIGLDKNRDIDRVPPHLNKSQIIEFKNNMTTIFKKKNPTNLHLSCKNFK